VLDRTLHVGDLSTNSRDVQAELDQITTTARNELEAMVHGDEALATIGPLRRHVAVGRPSHAIVEVASRLRADLIVMGTHGRTGLRRAVIGSVAEYVVRHAPCSVMCVKPTLLEEPTAG
jgi:nucleotide-binding universal stress UspA family protein